MVTAKIPIAVGTGFAVSFSEFIIEGTSPLEAFGRAFISMILLGIFVGAQNLGKSPYSPGILYVIGFLTIGTALILMAGYLRMKKRGWRYEQGGALCKGERCKQNI